MSLFIIYEKKVCSSEKKLWGEANLLKCFFLHANACTFLNSLMEESWHYVGLRKPPLYDVFKFNFSRMKFKSLWPYLIS